MKIVVDTNIFISALIKDGAARQILTNPKLNLLFPEWGLEEIYSYKEIIMQKADLKERDFDILLLRLLKYIRLIPFNIIIKFKKEADVIMNKIDREDSAFIATALTFNCPIWTEDKHFSRQKKIKILSTEDMLKYLSSSDY